MPRLLSAGLAQWWRRGRPAGNLLEIYWKSTGNLLDRRTPPHPFHSEFCSPSSDMATFMSGWVAVMAFAFLQVAATVSLEARASAADFKVLRPRSGDVIVSEDSSFMFNVTWVNNTLDFNASILLRQGPPENLRQVAILNGPSTGNTRSECRC